MAHHIVTARWTLAPTGPSRRLAAACRSPTRQPRSPLDVQLLVFAILGIKPGALYVLGQHSAMERRPQPWWCAFVKSVPGREPQFVAFRALAFLTQQTFLETLPLRGASSAWACFWGASGAGGHPRVGGHISMGSGTRANGSPSSKGSGIQLSGASVSLAPKKAHTPFGLPFQPSAPGTIVMLATKDPTSPPSLEIRRASWPGQARAQMCWTQAHM